VSFGVGIYPTKKGHFAGICECVRERASSFRHRERGLGLEGLTLRLFLFSFDPSLIPNPPIQPPQPHTHIYTCLSLFPFSLSLSFLGFRSDRSFPFRSERVSSLLWLQSASSRSSRTCRKTHQLLAALVPLFFSIPLPHHDFFVRTIWDVIKIYFFPGFLFVLGLNEINLNKRKLGCFCHIL